ncbi:MAG TPA: ATP-binding cassette domain-containing protein, partial [Streptosporangiaceae bacterium]|nr:ATP-binding cassette domain-containing protein [Streptosporangiaceae bacterium]
MTAAALRIEEVRKHFGDTAALKGVTFEVRPREVVGLVGENGAGKSTLMKILIGALAADAGAISVAGRLGYCPQEPVVYERLTCDEHFELFGHAYGLTPEQERSSRRDLRGAGFRAVRGHPRRSAVRRHTGQAQPRAGPAARPRGAAAGRAVRRLRLRHLPEVLGSGRPPPRGGP